MVGPLVKLEVLRSAGVGIALEKRGNVAMAHHVVHVQPQAAAERLHHGVERSTRLRGIFGGLGVGRLRVESPAAPTAKRVPRRPPKSSA
jgi:hypothetical protein